MAEAQDPYGLMAALSAPPQQQATPLVAPYIPPMAATVGAGLSAVGAQQMALQKQLFDEEEKRRKERESEMQTRGKQIYDVGMATFQPEVAARGAAMQTGGLMPMASQSFQPAVEMAQLTKGAEALAKATEVGKLLTPESGKALLERSASQIPALSGLQFDFAQKVAGRTTESLQRLKEMDNNLETRATALSTALQNSGVLTGDKRTAAVSQLDIINKARARLWNLSEEEVNSLYSETMLATPPLEYGMRTRSSLSPGRHEKIQGDRKVTVEVSAEGVERIVGQPENLALTNPQLVRKQLGERAADHADAVLKLAIEKFDWTKVQAKLDEARKNAQEGRLAEWQVERLKLAEQLFRIREAGEGRADRMLLLDTMKYLYPQVDPAVDMGNAYRTAREMLIDKTLPDGRSVRSLLGSRLQADKDDAESFIAANIDDQASILYDQKLGNLRSALESNPALGDALFENLRLGATQRPDLIDPLGYRRPTSAPAPGGGSSGLVPAPPAVSGATGSLPAASAAEPASIALPGLRVPIRAPVLPPAVSRGAEAGSPRATAPRETKTLKGAISRPEGRRSGVRIRPPGSR